VVDKLRVARKVIRRKAGEPANRKVEMAEKFSTSNLRTVSAKVIPDTEMCFRGRQPIQSQSNSRPNNETRPQAPSGGGTGKK